MVSTDRGREFTRLTNRSHPGKWVVLFSWPMDFTFVCPTEIAEFGKRNSEFEDPRCPVARHEHGPHFVHLAWRRDHADLKTLPYPMLAVIPPGLDVSVPLDTDSVPIVRDALDTLVPQGRALAARRPEREVRDAASPRTS